MLAPRWMCRIFCLLGLNVLCEDPFPGANLVRLKFDVRWESENCGWHPNIRLSLNPWNSEANHERGYSHFILRMIPLHTMFFLVRHILKYAWVKVYIWRNSKGRRHSVFLLFIGCVRSGFVWLINGCFWWKFLCTLCVSVSWLLDVAPVSLGQEALPMQWNNVYFSVWRRKKPSSCPRGQTGKRSGWKGFKAKNTLVHRHS